jgi:tetratricopeptide (TPR) repeat protein
MLAGNHKEALEQLEFAHDCDPQNGLYRAELAYCRYLREPDFAARKSLQELAEALRIDPNCGLAVYYTGKIHTDLGNADEAETFLRQSIKMMAPDRRPIQALKDLAAQKQVTAKAGRRLF